MGLTGAAPSPAGASAQQQCVHDTVCARDVILPVPKDSHTRRFKRFKTCYTDEQKLAKDCAVAWREIDISRLERALHRSRGGRARARTCKPRGLAQSPNPTFMSTLLLRASRQWRAHITHHKMRLHVRCRTHRPYPPPHRHPHAPRARLSPRFSRASACTAGYAACRLAFAFVRTWEAQRPSCEVSCRHIGGTVR